MVLLVAVVLLVLLVIQTVLKVDQDLTQLQDLVVVV